METAGIKRPVVLAIAGTIAAFLPQYFMRWNGSAYMFFYDTLHTYSGDLWNFFANYLAKGLHYPPEYPAGLRFAYEALGLYRIHDYTVFFTLNTIVLAVFAAGTTWLMFKILANRSVGQGRPLDVSGLWYFWILAPSLLFYGAYNYDLAVVFLVVLAVFLYLEHKPYLAVAVLAVGTVVKVFPVFLLPAFIFMSPRRYWLPMATLFGSVAIALNLPYALSDFHSWLYPYVWQISSNLTTSPAGNTYWWIIYPLAGRFTGWLSLGLFAILYVLALRVIASRKMSGREDAFLDLCLAAILLFLLTDRIYSPQYDLYLLPFLVLAYRKIDLRLFYAIEIPNLLLGLFLFFLR
ncbi:MAG: DUF2029 domain-containing protein [Patescibacteria group bacterium]|nr:DUF2029 domain-containing protein [Patescibacteria group bacterium]